MIKLTKDEMDYILKALDYIALSLDGHAPDNSDLSEIDKLHVLSSCYYVQQMLMHEILNDDNQSEGNKKIQGISIPIE